MKFFVKLGKSTSKINCFIEVCGGECLSRFCIVKVSKEDENIFMTTKAGWNKNQCSEPKDHVLKTHAVVNKKWYKFLGKQW